MKTLKPYLALCKLPISLFAACSAATGFFVASHHHGAAVLVPVAAVFALACGASALNQYQERDIDARMERTRQRPLPSQAISPARALSAALILLLSGLFLLFYGGGAIAVWLGIAAILWYNGVYTFLKKKTAFASVPGALVGAIPPAIGWVSTGGAAPDARLFALCSLWFLWQIPHFWLLLLNSGDDYEKAGLPSLSRNMSKGRIVRVTYMWIVATSAASLSLPLYRMISSLPAYGALLLIALWLMVNGARLLRTGAAASGGTFRVINVFVFLLMATLSLDNLLS